MTEHRATGGHAPDEYRAAFLGWIGALPDGGWSEFDHAAFVAPEVDGKPRSARWLAGQLSNCADIVPGWACDNLDIAQGSTYAQAARKVVSDLDAIPEPED